MLKNNQTATTLASLEGLQPWPSARPVRPSIGCMEVGKWEFCVSEGVVAEEAPTPPSSGDEAGEAHVKGVEVSRAVCLSKASFAQQLKHDRLYSSNQLCDGVTFDEPDSEADPRGNTVAKRCNIAARPAKKRNRGLPACETNPRPRRRRQVGTSEGEEDDGNRGETTSLDEHPDGSSDEEESSSPVVMTRRQKALAAAAAASVAEAESLQVRVDRNSQGLRRLRKSLSQRGLSTPEVSVPWDPQGHPSTSSTNRGLSTGCSLVSQASGSATSESGGTSSVATCSAIPQLQGPKPILSSSDSLRTALESEQRAKASGSLSTNIEGPAPKAPVYQSTNASCQNAIVTPEDAAKAALEAWKRAKALRVRATNNEPSSERSPRQLLSPERDPNLHPAPQVLHDASLGDAKLHRLQRKDVELQNIVDAIGHCEAEHSDVISRRPDELNAPPIVGQKAPVDGVVPACRNGDHHARDDDAGRADAVIQAASGNSHCDQSRGELAFQDLNEDAIAREGVEAHTHAPTGSKDVRSLESIAEVLGLEDAARQVFAVSQDSRADTTCSVPNESEIAGVAIANLSTVEDGKAIVVSHIARGAVEEMNFVLADKPMDLVGPEKNVNIRRKRNLEDNEACGLKSRKPRSRSRSQTRSRSVSPITPIGTHRLTAPDPITKAPGENVSPSAADAAETQKRHMIVSTGAVRNSAKVMEWDPATGQMVASNLDLRSLLEEGYSGSVSDLNGPRQGVAVPKASTEQHQAPPPEQQQRQGQHQLQHQDLRTPQLPQPKVQPQQPALQRILVCANMQGRFDLLQKVLDDHERRGQAVHFVLGVGSFLSAAAAKSHSGSTAEADYLEKPAKRCFSVPVYFIDQFSKTLIDKAGSSGKALVLNPNLIFLGGAGMIELGGLRIGFLSGNYSHNEAQFRDIWGVGAFHGAHYNLKAEEELLRRARARDGPAATVDVLLTSEWPDRFWSTGKEQEAPTPVPRKFASPAVTRLFFALKPRYHVCAGAEDYRYRKASQGPHDFVCTSIALASPHSTDREARWHHTIVLRSDALGRPEAASRVAPKVSAQSAPLVAKRPVQRTLPKRPLREDETSPVSPTKMIKPQPCWQSDDDTSPV